MALMARPGGQGTSGVVRTTATTNRLGRIFPVKPLVTPFNNPIGGASNAGAIIVDSGQYEIVFSFSANVTNANTEFYLRMNAVNGNGAKPPVRYSRAKAGGMIDGCYRAFTNVTPEHIAAGQVSLIIEGAATAGTEDITWTHSELSIRRIGNAI